MNKSKDKDGAEDKDGAKNDDLEEEEYVPGESTITAHVRK